MDPMTAYLEALENWAEARGEYRAAYAGYKGYSPDWALDHHIRRCERATKDVQETLRALIRAEVLSALEAGEEE